MKTVDRLRGRRKFIAKVLLLGFLAILLPLSSSSMASAGSLCSDGWVSGSSGSGTCSWHGGIASGGFYYPGTTTIYKAPTDYRVKTYANCSALRKQFVFGVRKTIKYPSYYLPTFYFPSLYDKNKKLDSNRDGAICEMIKSFPTSTTVTAPSPTPTPTPTPTPSLKLGSLNKPAQPGQTVETAGIEFTLLNTPTEADTIVCGLKVVIAVKGCLYAVNTWGSIERPTGADPASARKWVAVDLRIKRLKSSLYFYPLSSWDFRIYSSQDSSSWTLYNAPNMTSADLEPYQGDETRNATLYISVPKNADFSRSVFGIVDLVETPSIESQSRYFFPIR